MSETNKPAEQPPGRRAPRPFLRWLKPKHEVLSFEELYLRESDRLGDRVGKESVHVRTDTAGEPWVAFTPKDRFGLALSGGGIRSATFNLGLLQALAQLGVLRQVDYLSTVSGGGYIGGFWTAWLARHRGRPGVARSPLVNDQRGGERAEVRHLREFSRFLLPRAGVFETEFWGILMTVLGGLIPSFVAALAVLVVLWHAWLLILASIAAGLSCSVPTLVTLLFGYLAFSELRWRGSGKSEHNPAETVGYVIGGAFGLLITGGLAWLHLPEPALDNWKSLQELNVIFAPASVIGASTLVLLGLRTVAVRICRGATSLPQLVGVERALTRFLGITAVLMAAATLWWLAGVIAGTSEGWAVKVTGGGVALSTALFAWAKKWLEEPPKETRGDTVVRAAIGSLKRATPKVLAGIVWLLLLLLVGAAIHAWGMHVGDWEPAQACGAVINQTAGGVPLAAAGLNAKAFWLLSVASLLIIGATAWWFDPARVGMHEFYRSRISRCYLGASNPATETITGEHERAGANRHVSERPDDDLKLNELAPEGQETRPLQLICTAANDMSGDHLGTLYRGARSAVLSANGISLGNETAELTDLRMSSALTASAAAFNSQMGRISMDLGPAVTFLMAALNLRLGLWVPHPSNRFRGNFTFPGRFFLFELLGRSRTDKSHLHLSDGNHFENFGLYELIRRHCRYIIVSDCGADPEVAFDDLANVLRRVREDFGVEIELDVSALQPGDDGRARQHAVVGTIHYNGANGMDKGTILFFKPVLTGDEPPDVLQYRTRNQTFPHESTGDQFYDEAQWESYRRLGEHAGRMVLGFFDQPDEKDTHAPDRLFRDARSRWHPAPEQQDENFLEMTGRCASLEADLITSGPARLRCEFFPEAVELARARGAADSAPAAASTPDWEEDLQTLSFLMRLMQIMEDVWLAADLDRYWSHPLNEGWMNYFHRWAATPSFRRWWPILAPTYGPGFREFAKQRFGVGVTDETARGGRERNIAAARLFLKEIPDAAQFLQTTLVGRQFRQLHPASILSGRSLLGYDLELLGYEGTTDGHKIGVGFVAVNEREKNGLWTAEWKADEFFVPPTLFGAGIVARLLDAVIMHYRSAPGRQPAKTFAELRVQFAGTGTTGSQPARQKTKPLGPAARYERVREIEFYKSRGFHYVTREDPATGTIELRLSLPGK